MAAWAWQQRALTETLDLLGRGVLSVCVTAPTGAGKGKMIEDLVVHFTDLGARVILFTDRKMLTKQTGDRFAAAGINFGYVSASHGMDTFPSVLIASIQTLRSRLKKAVMRLPEADLVICDECHRRTHDFCVNLYRLRNLGVSVVGYTASPVGLKDKYDALVVAGTKPECRAGGALVPCRVIGLPSPDMRGVRMTKVGEYEQKGMAKRVMQCTAFADIFDTWMKHGIHRPTLVWAPGVPESRWIAEQFNKRGITAAHIDGETEEDERSRIRGGSCDGSIYVVSSCGVLREGVDWPWISYGILLQVCGAYETFVQIVGRLLRSYPGKFDAILQDHSGTWWRHGSPNFDRQWSLDDTNTSIAAERKPPANDPGDNEGPKDSEPICCPRCNGIRIGGVKCPHCGYESARGVRLIKKENGELVDMCKPPPPQKSRFEKTWASVLFRCGSTGKTFSQAAWLYHKETGQWAQSTPGCWPKPSPGSDDWSRKIADIYPKYNRRSKNV
jgi:DNA repair protein RadD